MSVYRSIAAGHNTAWENSARLHSWMQSALAIIPSVAGGLATLRAWDGLIMPIHDFGVTIDPTGMPGDAILYQGDVGRIGLVDDCFGEPFTEREDGSLTSEIGLTHARLYLYQAWLSRRKSKHRPS